MKTKNVTIFIHHHDDGPARFADIFETLGFNQTHIFTPEDSLQNFDPLKPDLLAVMGGPMGVYEADKHPYLTDEIEILKTRIAADKPTLGICLGSQLIAAALGARVYKSDYGFEIGWHKLIVNEEGQKSPVHHLDGNFAHMFHWHQDTFDLPEGATLLASSETYPNQIFRYGENIMALQCHPEIMDDQIEIWASSIEDKKEKDAMRAGAVHYMAGMDKQLRVFTLEWLAKTGVL